ncbi:hypothetical protein [Hymenobacter sp. APR13]|uniref:hypothetical protein n=1 Tax=Hymenobacter sp. APR13 TaxID=1356852 RepID=UPI0004E05E18|nr:hypothetical protein [Hymenobacter sp. APR13]AII53499.1 hypothetical protein N008_16140 [Hymenobacter sp. APR13]
MNAKRVAAALLWVALLLCGSCRFTPEEIPATITTKATPQHQRIPGTHMLLAAPAEYELNPQEHLLRLNPLQFVQVVEFPGVKFAAYLEQLQKELAGQPDIPATALRHLTYNGRPAVFLTQPYRRGPGLTAALLAFGDSSRVTLLVGVYPKFMPGAATTCQQILLTAHYDPAVKVQEQEVSGFQANMLDTDFRQLTPQMGRWTVYVPQGRIGADGDTAHATLFRVCTLPPIAERTTVQDIAVSIIREYRTVASVENVQETHNTINGHYAYENVITFNYAGKEGRALVLLLSTPTGILVFDGRAYEQPEVRLEQFMRLAKAMRLAPPAS